MGLKVKLCENDLIWELIDGEIVILNFRNGNYFTLDGIGVYFWELVLKSGDSGEISSKIFQYYKSEVRQEEIENATLNFINEFIREGLVTPDGDMAAKESSTEISLDFLATVKDKPGFSTLVMHSYRDFQEKFAHPCGIKRSDE